MNLHDNNDTKNNRDAGRSRARFEKARTEKAQNTRNGSYANQKTGRNEGRAEKQNTARNGERTNPKGARNLNQNDVPRGSWERGSVKAPARGSRGERDAVRERTARTAARTMHGAQNDASISHDAFTARRDASGFGREARGANGSVHDAFTAPHDASGFTHNARRDASGFTHHARRDASCVTQSASHDEPSLTEPIRLQTLLAHSGVASRRACESIIESGRVTVNGVTVTAMGTKVMPTDTVCVDGVAIARESVKRYVLLNKPSGYVCSMIDEKGRAVAADLLKPHFTERLYNVGRLDMFSSGAILFTNDGDFAAAVSHPSSEIEKEYIVETSLPYPRDLCKKFMHGVRVDNVFYKCRLAEELSSHRMRIVLIEGKNREIRRVLDSFDVRVKSLTRTRIAFLSLDSFPDTGGVKSGSPNGGGTGGRIKNGAASLLQPGQFRELTKNEVERLLLLCKKKEQAKSTDVSANNAASAFVKTDIITY